MEKTILVIDQRGAREIETGEAIPANQFLIKNHIDLNDGIRSANQVKIMSPQGDFAFNPNHLSSPESARLIEPGSAFLVGIRSDEEIQYARTWLSSRQEKASTSGTQSGNEARAEGKTSQAIPIAAVNSSSDKAAAILNDTSHFGWVLIAIVFAVVIIGAVKFSIKRKAERAMKDTHKR